MHEFSMSGRLPENVAAFLSRYIATVDQLEILLLLHADTDRRWSAREIGARMRRPETAVAARLETMLNQKLVERDEHGFRYAAGAHDVDVGAVEHSFAIRRPAVISAIFSKP